MALDKVAIVNEALGEIPVDAIASFDEESVAAEWAARRYPPALAYLLELHDWKFAVRRQVLAEVENDRPGEWSYAYEVPTDVAAELRVFPTYIAAPPSSIPLLAGQFLAPPTTAFLEPLLSQGVYPYLLSNGKIYTGFADAELEFISEDPGEATFSALFARALALELASRLVMPLKKDAKRQGELIQMAEVARDRAIADMRNRDPSESRYGYYVNESEIARGDGYYGYGYPAFYPGYWTAR